MLWNMQLFAYDTVKKQLSPKPGEQPKIPFPPSSIAGAVAGVSSTLCMYPLELLKTRLTVQVCTQSSLIYAPSDVNLCEYSKNCREECTRT